MGRRRRLGHGPGDGLLALAVHASGQYLVARVTCLTVDGQDAWIGGAITRSSEWVPGEAFLGVWVRVHDGGRGGAGDTVIFGLDDTGADALNRCVTMSRELDELLRPVNVGGIAIR